VFKDQVFQQITHLKNVICDDKLFSQYNNIQHKFLDAVNCFASDASYRQQLATQVLSQLSKNVINFDQFCNLKNNVLSITQHLLSEGHNLSCNLQSLLQENAKDFFKQHLTTLYGSVDQFASMVEKVGSSFTNLFKEQIALDSLLEPLTSKILAIILNFVLKKMKE